MEKLEYSKNTHIYRTALAWVTCGFLRHQSQKPASRLTLYGFNKTRHSLVVLERSNVCFFLPGKLCASFFNPRSHPPVSAWAQPCLEPMWAPPRSLSDERPPAMCDNGDPEDKPPAPPVRMSSTIFSTGKDSLSANHSSKPLPSVPEERKPRNKIISIFSGAEKGELAGFLRSWKTWKSHGILKWSFPGLEVMETIKS